jgi:hypothetical protein
MAPKEKKETSKMKLNRGLAFSLLKIDGSLRTLAVSVIRKTTTHAYEYRTISFRKKSHLH